MEGVREVRFWGSASDISMQISFCTNTNKDISEAQETISHTTMLARVILKKIKRKMPFDMANVIII
jgi:queuine/archaeosine tRNA-ribosyltransferase